MHTSAANLARLVSAVFLLCSSMAYSDEPNSKSVYRVGVEDIDYFPMFTEQKDREKPGFLIDLLEAFADQQGIEFEYIYLPITRFNLWYERDNIDFRIPDQPLWHAKDTPLIFSDDIIEVGTSTVVLSSNANQPLENFNTIGSIYGFTPSPKWQSQIDKGKLEYVYGSSMKILLRLLKQGFVDGLDVNLAVARHYAEEMGYARDEFVIAQELDVIQFSYTLSTLSHPQVLKEFNQFLVQSKNLVDQIKLRNGLAN